MWNRKQRVFARNLRSTLCYNTCYESLFQIIQSIVTCIRNNLKSNYSSTCGLTFLKVRPWSVAWLPTNKFQCSKISSTERKPSAFSSLPSIRCSVSSCVSWTFSGRTQALASSRSILPSLFLSNWLWKSWRCRVTQAGGSVASWYWPRNSSTVMTLCGKCKYHYGFSVARKSVLK